MNTALERRLPEDTRLALGRFLVKLRVARAAELARAGELHEAEAVLKQPCEAPHTPDELDLLARIAARQGRFKEACRLWEAALHQVPGNENYRHCLESLKPGKRFIRSIINSKDLLLSILVWTAAVCGIAVLVYSFRG